MYNRHAWRAGSARRVLPSFSALFLLLACSNDARRELTAHEPAQAGVLYRADVEPVRSPAETQAGVFIPPYVDCREARSGARGESESGQVCTNVAISGCTEPERYFPDYASCEVVRTQRPYWPAPRAAEPDPNDARLSDRAFMDELAWVTQQIEASGCTCCHDARAMPGPPSQWDIRAQPIWLSTLSDSGLALFLGLADSSVLGAYAPDDNHGFQRDVTGIPSTDGARMQRFLRAELERRGISERQAASVPPFGGPIYANSVAAAGTCGPNEGVSDKGEVIWQGGPARYVYVTAPDAPNPGVPPNLDLPVGTFWRLDVRASESPLASGVAFGTTPQGTFQTFPVDRPASALERGRVYRLYVLRDVGVPLANCTFTFGASSPAAAPPEQEAPVERAPGESQACDEVETTSTFGKPCSDAASHAECGCAADYCAIQPGQRSGYCTARDCARDPSVCPMNWTCLDLSAFRPGEPSICVAP